MMSFLRNRIPGCVPMLRITLMPWRVVAYTRPAVVADAIETIGFVVIALLIVVLR